MHMEGDDDELEDSDCRHVFHDCVQMQSAHLYVILGARANLPRRLFKGGVYFTQRLQLCGVYLRAVSIQGRRLFTEIRYVHTYPVKETDNQVYDANGLDPSVIRNQVSRLVTQVDGYPGSLS